MMVGVAPHVVKGSVTVGELAVVKEFVDAAPEVKAAAPITDVLRRFRYLPRFAGEVGPTDTTMARHTRAEPKTPNLNL